MKILLLCAGGASTSILMKKMIKYWEDKGIPLEITAKGVGEFESYAPDYEIILLGPQIRYKLDAVKDLTGKPTALIEPYDYAIGNAENIYKQVQKLLAA